MVASATFPTQAAEKSAIERALNGLRWGMSAREVQQHIGAERTRWATQLPYAELIPEATEQTVLESRDPFTRTWHVFRKQQLCKVLVALEPLAFPEGNFAAFAASLRRRFGAAELETGQLTPATAEPRTWIEWHDRTTRLRAIDETNHRGAYLLLFEPHPKRNAGRALSSRP